jgi:hypothetical protein
MVSRMWLYTYIVCGFPLPISFVFYLLAYFCVALCSLNVENCSITSKTIQKIADALDSGSVLSHLCIGTINLVIFNTLILGIFLV